MKSFKIQLACTAFAVAAISALFFSSCRKEETVPPTPEVFAKEVTLTDRDGKNTAVVRFTSEIESLLEETDFVKSIEIEPVFEAPSVENFEGKSASEDFQAKPDIEMELISQQLEEGAVGLKFNFSNESNGAIQERAATTLTFTTSFDNIQVVTWSGCTANHYYRRLYYSSPYVWMAGYSACAYAWTYAAVIPSYRMRVVVVYSNAGFTIYAW